MRWPYTSKAGARTGGRLWRFLDIVLRNTFDFPTCVPLAVGPDPEASPPDSSDVSRLPCRQACHAQTHSAGTIGDCLEYKGSDALAVWRMLML